jgi:hypothetical protein
MEMYKENGGDSEGQCEFLNCNIVEAGDGKWDIQRKCLYSWSILHLSCNKPEKKNLVGGARLVF